jgi:hypothetical protein
MAELTRIYSKEANGRWFELRNWRSRSDPFDVIVKRPLLSWEERLLMELKAEGYSDAAIYTHLQEAFKTSDKAQPGRLELSAKQLTKHQLIQLICQLLGSEANSISTFEKMSHEDLLTLLRSLSHRPGFEFSIKNI